MHSVAVSSSSSITTRDEVKRALQPGRVTVLYFTAHWCGPCKRIGPEFERLTRMHAAVTGLKVDVEEADKDLLEHFQVEAMPTFVFIRGKEVVYTQHSADAAALKNAYNLYVPSNGATCPACRREIIGGAHHPTTSMCTRPMCDKCVWLNCMACYTKPTV
jgi:thioredoxin 1